jgi:hypothetical protein
MRGIVLLLLLANACVAAYAFLESSGNEPNPLHVPFKSERVKLLTPQQVAALGPGKVAQLNITCAEWGPMSDSERTVAMEALTPLQLGKTVSQQRVEIPKPYWVSVAAKPGKNGLDKTLKDVQDLGIEGAEKIKLDDGNHVFAGVFRTENAARERATSLESKGLTSVKVRPRDTPLAGTIIIVREPQQATVAALEAAKSKFGDVGLQFASCRDRI